MIRTVSTRSLARAIAEIAEARDPRAALEVGLDFALEAAAADLGAVFLPAGTSLRLAFGRHLPPALVEQPPLLEAAAWYHGPVVRRPGPDSGSQALEQAARLAGIESWASIPMRLGDEAFGLILIASRDLIGLPQEVLEVLEITSRVLAMALERHQRRPTYVGPRPGPARDLG
jgi:GAF domain-containing protein